MDIYPDWVWHLCIAGPFIIAFGYVAYKNITATQWDKGMFPQKLEKTKDNIMEAYVCLAAWMLRADRKESIEKIEYMAKYFHSHLGNTDFKERLNFAYRNEIEIRTITSWLKLNLNQSERSQVLYFLVGLSIVDGTIDSREKHILNQVRHFLDIPPKDLQSIIASYYQQRHRKRTTNSSTNTVSAKKSALKLSYEILGISDQASLDEIKKAYRKMVKAHHPDRFATVTIEQQKIAEKRFIEIQKAYETIEKLR